MEAHAELELQEELRAEGRSDAGDNGGAALQWSHASWFALGHRDALQ